MKWVITYDLWYNPPWLRDELILALELYLENRQAPPGPDSPATLRLSETLNRLGAHLHAARHEKYRNPNGVAMKLRSFRRLDPAFPAARGLSHGNKAEAEVWRDFADHPARRRRAAAAIRAAIAAFDRGEAETLDLDADGLMEAEEGRAVTRLHRSRERDRRLVERKKQAVLKAEGRLLCEACGFDVSAVYGPRGADSLECHDTRPAHALRPGDRTRLADLRLLCANCHRMIHAARLWLSIEQLRGIVGANSLLT